MKRNWILPPTWLKFFIVTLLVLGLFFRFVNLDRKVYWGDEAATSLRISGYTEREIRQQAFNGEIRSIEALQKYQRLNVEKDLTDTIKGLVLEEPQLPPLYYVMVRTWVQWFGDSVAATRSFSALISLLVFPCLYWLCLELFKSPLVAWVAIALVAISPFHVLYAQEARLYSLWTLTILLSSAALLRAIRLKNRLSWFFYAATLSIGFYTTPLTALVAIGHGIYVIGTQGIRTSKLIAYLLASFIGVLTYIPWIFVVASNLAASSSTTEWASRKIPAFQTLASFLINIIIVYLDIPSNFLWKAPPNTYQVTDILLGFFSIPILSTLR